MCPTEPCDSERRTKYSPRYVGSTACGYVEDYHPVRLHSAIGYITPADKLAGNAEKIFESREVKLNAARSQRQKKRLRGKQ
jgi:hypothetical protein